MKRMSDDVRFRSLGEKEQRSEWEGRLRELQMEIQEREQRNKEEEQKIQVRWTNSKTRESLQ